MNRRSIRVDTAFILLLFCGFMLAAAAMVLDGVRVWQRTETTMVQTNDTQTALCYLSNKVRQNDAGSLYLDEVDGIPALAMETDIDGIAYITRLYCYDGQLRELYTPAEILLPASSGVGLMDATALTFSMEHGMIRATFTAADGTQASVLLAARAGKEVTP